MRRSPPNSALLMLMVMAPALLVAAAAAAAEPDPIDHLRTVDRPTPEDRAKIEAYAAYWAPRLATKDDPAAIDKARDQILLHLGGGESPVFRDAYTRALAPRLHAVLADREQHLGAVNAVLIFGQLGTADALQQIQRYFRDDRMIVRIWAARGMTALLQDAGQQIIGADRLKVVRELGAAAGTEREWPALVAQIQAIAASESGNRVEVLLGSNPQERGVFEAVLRHMGEGREASPLMEALRRSMVVLRDLFLAAPDLEMGGRLMRVFVLLLEVVDGHWKALQQDPELKHTYGAAVRMAEAGLGRVDATVGQHAIRETTLEKSFTSGAHETFHAEVARIGKVVSGPPYQP